MQTWTRRDLTIISEFSHKNLVIACDSCGGIGNKSGDMLLLSPYYVGKLTVRVCLTEVLCSGAIPITVSNCVCCEMKPTGEEIIRGIKDEFKDANLENLILTGSTEENFKTVMTAAGITVIGVSESDLKFNKAFIKDKVVLIGTPKIGEEVNLTDKGFYEEIKYLLSLKNVREIAPVGSKGIAYEADTLAKLNGLNFTALNKEAFMYKSAGPVTCIIALSDEKTSKDILDHIKGSIIVGELN